MAALTADQIKAAPRRSRLKERDVPDWGGKVFLKSWSGRERIEFQSYISELVTNKNDISSLQSFAEVCVRGLVDENGLSIFNGDGVAILMEKDFTLLKDLSEEILAHNGLGTKTAELVEKNSPSSQSSDSGTSSLAV